MPTRKPLMPTPYPARVPTTSQARPPLRRAVLLMTGSSFLVPAAGVLTQPILAQALGAVGRGTLAAALAPAALAVSVATLGLPDALTYYLAKHPSVTRRALMGAAVLTLGVGVVCVLITIGALPFLSTGDPTLANLILLATVLTVPALVIGVFRGAATGRQMWSAVAGERLVNIVLRVIGFVTLLAFGRLSVMTAVLVSCLAPIVAGAVYWRLLLRPAVDDTEQPLGGRTVRLLLSYGNRVWLGSVASMLLARIGQILMAPLSSVEDLGYYSVATTVSDLPLIVALAISGAVFGVNSKARDAAQLTLTSRLTLLVNLVGCVLVGATAPFWIKPLFGAEFVGAIVPTVMLLASALLCIPGLLAATGVGAWGRPGLRSIGLGGTLVVNILVFVALVPPLGVIGACWTSMVSNVVLTGYMVMVASRVMGVPATDFFLLRVGDARRAWGEGLRLLGYLRRVPSGTR